MKVNLIGVLVNIKQQENATMGKLKYYEKPTKKIKEILFKDLEKERIELWKKSLNNNFYLNIQGELVLTDSNVLLSISKVDPLLELNLLIKNLEKEKKETEEDKLDIIGEI